MRRRTLLKSMGALGGAALVPAFAMPFRSASAQESLAKIAYQLSWVKNFQFAGEYIADHKGYFRDNGLDVDLLAGGPNIAMDPVVASGKALIAQSAPDFTANANSQGANLKIIGANYQKSPYAMISRADRPLQGPQDMIGKKIGIQANNLVLWNAFLALNGIDPTSINVVPAQHDFTPLVSGELDGFFGYSNDDVIQLRAKGNDVHYFLFADHGYKLFTATYTVREESLADPEQRAHIAAFMRAAIKGWQDAIEDPALAAKLTVEVYGKGNGLNEEAQKQSAAATNELMVNEATKEHGLFWMTDEAVQETIATLSAADVTATPDLFTNEILAEALDGKTQL
ncbi:ABC transporter substrate-binding protein [Consotaella salsifontis]|uniref:Thiamine pyrimidine synthase n=1 Tax=Consotaella salsifontis TaxID=1365950 RepID=A0A1T4S449_9HYPH|nr:ABC transporter substrate-binding protein [Consotaella salsifontis]SKA22591.1 ABC-type nitrate/sulfonate/bicarbonate transport system, substrate-binding protein [Consotaella salsifontis]